MIVLPSWNRYSVQEASLPAPIVQRIFALNQKNTIPKIPDQKFPRNWRRSNILRTDPKKNIRLYKDLLNIEDATVNRMYI